MVDSSLQGGHPFPTTMWSCVLAARDAGEPDEARPFLDQLIRVYWKPVYASIRKQWRGTPEEAKDWTQDFFLSFIDREAVAAVDRDKGSFRAYLKACLRHFMLDEKKRAGAAKRIGDTHHLSLEADREALAKLEADATCATPDETFDRAWLICLMDQGMDLVKSELVREGRAGEWEYFQTHDLGAEDLTYAQLAEKFGTTERTVKTSLQNVRRRLRHALRRRIGDYCLTDLEADAEFKALVADEDADA